MTKIKINRDGDEAVYISFEYVAKTTGEMKRLDELIENYRGPMVNLDLNAEGELMGIEIVIYSNDLPCETENSAS